MPQANREKEIFEAALDIASPQERSAHVEQACGGDAALVRRVNALLKASESASQFLPGTPDRTALICPAVPIAEGPATVIGRYKLLQQIGEGGFGVVYSAEQREPVKRWVALKIIKLGMDTKQVVARFEAERQALALMEHPNIAKVFDAGATETGRPFFVMELVKGIPITTYCDDHNHSVTERVKLFIQVCSAIQHAHQKGIIHRDIKPSNILVTLHDGVPVPKVIDFGIAKATQQELTEKTLFTEFHQFIGTPAYMSPEQAEFSGLDIDTRSDIYSLGVLLYELLTGSPPFDSKDLMSAGLDGMRQIIKTKEPLRPSTKLSQTLAAADVSPRKHSRAQPATRNPHPEDVSAGSRRRLQVKETITLLRGDLDWIVMKALEKDRQRRYETASGLAADLQRHLNNEPVTAVAPTFIYQTRKYYQRNRRKVQAALAFAGLLLLATLISIGQAVRANRNAGLATNNEDRALAGESAAQEAEERMRERLYAADMVATQQALRQGNLGLARDLLQQHLPRDEDPDLRGFEWRYFSERAHGDPIHTLRGHSNLVFSVRFSPDGRWLASGDWDGKVILWDVVERRMRFQFVPGGGKIVSIAFRDDGQLLGIGTESGLSIWRLNEQGQPRLLKQRAADRARIAFLPGTSRIAVGESSNRYSNNGAGEAMIWDYERDEVVQKFDRAGGKIALTADGGTLYTANVNGLILAWDPTTGERKAAGDFTWYLCGLACSRDGRWVIANASGRDHQVQLRSGRTLELDKTLLHYDRSIALWGADFSPDGRFAATCDSDQLIRVWNLETKSESAVLRGHGNEVWDVRFSPDGKWLASGDKDGTVCLWDPHPQRPATVVPGDAYWRFGNCIALSPNGGLLAGNANYHQVELWDLRAMRLLHSFTNMPTQLGFTRDGTQLLLLDTGLNLQSWTLNPLQLAAVTPLADPPSGISDMILSPDGAHLLAQASGGSELVLWNVETGQVIEHHHSTNGPAGVIRFFPDGQRFLTINDDEVLTWRLNPFSVEHRLQPGHQGRVSTVAISPDGQRIVTGSRDNTLKLWPASAGEELMRLAGHKRGVLDASFDPLGNTLATCGDDVNVQFWNLKTGRAVGDWRGTRRLEQVIFSADGSCVAVMENGVGTHLLRASNPTEAQATSGSPPSPSATLDVNRVMPSEPLVDSAHIESAHAIPVILPAPAAPDPEVLSEVLACDEFDGTGGYGWLDPEPNPPTDGWGHFSHTHGNWTARRFNRQPFTNTIWMAITMKMSAPADDYYCVVPGNWLEAHGKPQFFTTGFDPRHATRGMHAPDVYSDYDQLEPQTFLYRFDSRSGQTRYSVWILAGEATSADAPSVPPLAEGWVKQPTPGVNSYYRTFGTGGKQHLLVDRIGVGTSARAALGWVKKDK